jgi:Flp pilus assembly protein TadG
MTARKRATTTIDENRRLPQFARAGLQREHGQAMVEFTLMILLLLVVVFGIIDFGAALYDQTMLASAATDGARSGAIDDGSTSSAQSAAQAAVNNAIGCTPTASATTVAGPPQQIQVTVTCNFSGITPLGSLVSVVIHSITAQSSAKIEQ